MYTRGDNRLFLQTHDSSDEHLEIEFINPKLDKSKRFNMIYIEDVLYYIDIIFRYLGPYSARVYKNNNKIYHSVIKVGPGMIIYPDVARLI